MVPVGDQARRLAAFGGLWLAAILSVGIVLAGGWPELGVGDLPRTLAAPDAFAYWSAWHRAAGILYPAGTSLAVANYIYPPPLAQLLYVPTMVLPWPVFATGWMAALAAAFIWMLWDLPWLWRIPAMLACFLPWAGGNIEPFIGVALILALRHPAAWSFAVLTKVTPGVGLLWHAGRGEWRHVALALIATAAVAGASFAIAPHLWVAWAQAVSLDPAGRHGLTSGLFAWLPHLPIRLGVAALVVLYAARTSRPSLLAIALLLASPEIITAPFGVLAAIPRLTRSVDR